MTRVYRKKNSIKKHLNELLRSIFWLREKADQLQFCSDVDFVKIGFCEIEVQSKWFCGYVFKV